MVTTKDRLLWGVAVIILGLFLATRLYRLPESLLFFNDMGRDFLELLEWRQTGIPPLLGPQTSAFAFNQSAVYYYLLYPLYLLSGFSPFSSVYTALVWYSGWFLLGVYVFRRDPSRLRVLILAALILVFQTRLFQQTRFIWNPSFTPPLILAALFAHQSLMKRYSFKAAVVFAAAFAVSIGLTYATGPLMAILFVSLVPYIKRDSFKLLSACATALILVYVPTFAFELRHHFTLTNLFLHTPPMPQPPATVIQKFHDLMAFTLTPTSLLNYGLLLVLGGLVTMSRGPARRYGGLWLILVALTLAAPIHIEAHYIFPTLVLGAFVVALLPVRLSLPVAGLMAGIYVVALNLPVQYLPARRTVADMQACYRQFCARYPEPMYVSGQAGFHPYHNLPEHRYFMATSGCRVLAIETQPEQGEAMAVVLDDSVYEHGKTAYNELTLFGPSEDAGEFSCQPNLSVHVLKKVTDEK